MIPIAAIGSSWALWPTFADIGALLFAVGLVMNSRRVISDDKTRSLRSGLLLIVLGCGVSYLLVTILFAHYDLRSSHNDRGLIFGSFFLFRMAEFALIFWGTTKIAFTAKRLRILTSLVTLALVATCLPVILTYFGIVSCKTLVSHLPGNMSNVGFWAVYWASEKRGLGTIGYNHAYTAVQILLLLALRMHLAKRSTLVAESLLMILALIAIFMSGSRSGLAVAVIYSVLMAAKRPQLAIVAGVIALCGATMIFDLVPNNMSDQFLLTVERQSTILEADDVDNLSGRWDIWLEYLDYLYRNPVCFVTGSGLGSSFEFSRGGHLLYLTILTETGLFGLLIFLGFFLKILSLLLKHEAGIQPLFWATICLLVSCLTQETFYPVTALGHFIGFYLCCIALALRKRRHVPELRQLPTSAMLAISS